MLDIQIFYLPVPANLLQFSTMNAIVFFLEHHHVTNSAYGFRFADIQTPSCF